LEGFLVSTVVLAGAHEEVDGVRKEKERLTTDHQRQEKYDKKREMKK
jgi:tRNA G37 N-methylase TrmD